MNKQTLLWQQSKIGDLLEVTNGKTNSDDAVDDGNYPLFDRSVEIKRSNKYLFDTEALIVPGEGKEFFPRYFKGKFDLHQRAYAIFPKTTHRISLKYLSYWMFFKRDYLLKMAVGSTVKSLRLYMLQNFPVDYPDDIHQEQIARYFSLLDDAISISDQIIQKTEKLKQGLIGNLLTKGIGHKKFKNTKIGEFPIEWSIEKLSDFALVERGKFSHRPRNDPQFYGGSIPFIQTGDVVNSNGRIRSYSQTLNDRGLKISKLFSKGTIVLTIAANIGDTGILEFDACFPDSLVGITPSNKLDSVYLEYYLRSRKSFLNSIATQSAQKNINLAKLNPMLIAVPPISEQKEIGKILSSIDDKISGEFITKEKLQSLKNGLMQDIFSRKVEVN